MRIILYISVAFVGAGLLSKHIGRRISDACDWETSNSCADAGFGWEATGTFLCVGSATFIFVLVLMSAVRLVRNRL